MQTPQATKGFKNDRIRKTSDSEEENPDNMSISQKKAIKIKQVYHCRKSIATPELRNRYCHSNIIHYYPLQDKVDSDSLINKKCPGTAKASTKHNKKIVDSAIFIEDEDIPLTNFQNNMKRKVFEPNKILKNLKGSCSQVSDFLLPLNRENSRRSEWIFFLHWWRHIFYGINFVLGAWRN